MPRTARIVATNYPHHITQRGNYRQRIFAEDTEYDIYLKWLGKYADKYKLDILAYCLMPNHVHFAAIPGEPDSLAKTFNACHMRYSQYFNKKNDITGHLWQGRFYSCVMDERHLYAVARYIENNPVRARLVKEAWDWNWSSARAHTDRDREKGRIKLKDIADYIKVDDWEEYLKKRKGVKSSFYTLHRGRKGVKSSFYTLHRNKINLLHHVKTITNRISRSVVSCDEPGKAPG
ncbi:MAG: transposase, partial [Candidatus Omnitrophota bacterium]